MAPPNLIGLGLCVRAGIECMCLSGWERERDCMWLCVCERERERETERERERDREREKRERERESVCELIKCVCVQELSVHACNERVSHEKKRSLIGSFAICCNNLKLNFPLVCLPLHLLDSLNKILSEEKKIETYA